jgi:hypothetical protein
MYTLLIATADAGAREFLAAQLDADRHTVHEATAARRSPRSSPRTLSTC